MNAETRRLREVNTKKKPWRTWGPYVAGRQWGTVREDYSPDGKAWEFLTHDMARSKAYRWGEEGIAGICDNLQLVCFSLALWNGKDPFLKERLFGLTNDEGNHGEDVKEYYYYLDNTPTHSYMKMLYKYPQAEFPYARLVEENRRRGKTAPEFELIDTGIFDRNAYFDVFVEYAKASPEDILIRITVENRGAEKAIIHVLPHLWFRNTWAWTTGEEIPQLTPADNSAIKVYHPELGEYRLYFSGRPEMLFCNNETNTSRLYGTEAGGYFKDGINEYIVHGNLGGVNPSRLGTKAALHFTTELEAGACEIFKLRFSRRALTLPFRSFDTVFSRRQREADDFYTVEIQRADSVPGIADPDARNVQRQAFAGMLWTKQFYYYDVRRWLEGDPGQPAPPPERRRGRNRDWTHLNNADVITMPDNWEYPWYAAWDIAFHCIPFAMIDPEFAKHQLILMTREWYMHPNGQLPAYEWEFSDVNPPVHAWAAWRVYKIDRKRHGGKGDIPFLERVFHKLLLNFTWWVNRKDPEGRNIFQGGFLGLDNIGLFDRSSPLPNGGFIYQADGTSWMAMYCLNLMRIALELAIYNPVYEDIATKFFEHFLNIAAAMFNIGSEGVSLWDEEDEFYYDVLFVPGERVYPIKVRSLVGIIPLFAVETLEPEILEKLPGFNRRLNWYLKYRPDLAQLVSRWHEPGFGERRLLSLLRGHRMKRILKRMLDETEFLSDYGVRSLSKQHNADNPYRLT
ncbi:MAG: glucosidase, partial [Candidatus Latescibacter sp.]|nr:glucosidase [Candidatus Latescibacter sp.]